ncbi:MAG TPA: outer membrane beta-barrel protein [Terriglobales bacterium]|jgi:hypothetical protein|nr:outer membrane beta-barrel protein [Terriglobales bacterium]
MRSRHVLCGLIILFIALTAAAQQSDSAADQQSAPTATQQSKPKAPQQSKADIFAGYSYLRFDSASMGLPHQINLNGWAATGTVYVYKPWLGVVADFSGNYGKKYGLAFNAYNFLTGPELAYRRHRNTIFIRGLVGMARNNISGATNSGLEYGGGAGLDIRLRQHFAVRAFQADYLKTHTFGVDQTNIRVSAGLVFRWGGH